MGISIKNEEVERLARELAKRRNVSMTEAIRQSLEREVKRERAPEGGGVSMSERILALAREASTVPTDYRQSDDEILGYDGFGAPTR